jgi:hypothetical protein
MIRTSTPTLALPLRRGRVQVGGIQFSLFEVDGPVVIPIKENGDICSVMGYKTVNIGKIVDFVAWISEKIFCL